MYLIASAAMFALCAFIAGSEDVSGTTVAMCAAAGLAWPCTAPLMAALFAYCLYDMKFNKRG